jgi:hypothetical protein
MAKRVRRIVQGLAVVIASRTMSSWGGTLMPPYAELASMEEKADVEVLASMMGGCSELPA